MLSKKEVKFRLHFISEYKNDKKRSAIVTSAENNLSDFREECIAKMRKSILSNYTPVNAKEYEILGRAIQGCNQISILDDGSVYNAYDYDRKNTNTTRRAGELIDEAIKELEKEREEKENEKEVNS